MLLGWRHLAPYGLRCKAIRALGPENQTKNSRFCEPVNTNLFLVPKMMNNCYFWSVVETNAENMMILTGKCYMCKTKLSFYAVFWRSLYLCSEDSLGRRATVPGQDRVLLHICVRNLYVKDIFKEQWSDMLVGRRSEWESHYWPPDYFPTCGF